MIKNGNSTPLNQLSGTVPNVTGALLDWFQQMKFVRVTTTVVGFQAKETRTEIIARGVIQPFSDRRLMILPEGQRGWKWFTLHADTSLVLNLDEIVEYLGVRTRVMGSKDFSLYGYVEYQLCQDWV